MIELTHLTLKRLALCRFKSIQRVELDNLDNLVLLMGRNNAGKSNILDAFKFLSEAATKLPPEPWDETTWKDWTSGLAASLGRKGKAL